MTIRRYGVLPYTEDNGKKELVLVTSKTRRNWILPKGRRISGKSGAASALQEAYEEAGLLGRIKGSKAIRVVIRRRGKKILLILYPMRVEKILKRWPESKYRKRLSVSMQKAHRVMDCPGMKRSLKLWKGSN